MITENKTEAMMELESRLSAAYEGAQAAQIVRTARNNPEATVAYDNRARLGWPAGRGAGTIVWAEGLFTLQ